MRIITRKKPAFTDLYQTGVLTRIAAVKTDSGGWRLFGVWRDQDIAVFVEAARGGIREWSGLNYLAEFVFSCGISLWEVHNKTDRKLRHEVLRHNPLRRVFRLKSDMKQHASFCKKCYSPLEYSF
ncbi:hypothetical protein ACRABS_004840 [Salmonella enterica subsp. enterica]